MKSETKIREMLMDLSDTYTEDMPELRVFNMERLVDKVVKLCNEPEVAICSNKCKLSDATCEHCKKYWDVSTEEYRAQRYINENYVTGYLVKDKEHGNIEGILNKSTNYNELAWIKDETLEKVAE